MRIKMNNNDYDEDDDYYSDIQIKEKFSIIPFYRMYFLNRKDFGSRGIFLEVFMPITSLDITSGGQYNYYDNHYDSSEATTESTLAVGIGAGLGKKWINRKGVSLELFLGFGTYLHDDVDVIGN